MQITVFGTMHSHLSINCPHGHNLSAVRLSQHRQVSNFKTPFHAAQRLGRARCLKVHGQKRDKDPFSFDSFDKDMKNIFNKDMKNMFNKDVFNKNSWDTKSFSDSADYFGDAKKLYAEGERMFRNGQFQQGQRLFQQAEQQLRQAKGIFQPFDSRKVDFNSPTDPISNIKTWKASSLAVLGIATLAALVAGPLIAAFLATAVALGIAAMSLAALSFIWVIPVAGLLFWFANLFVFPLALTVGLTVGGVGIGAAAVSAFRGFLRKQPGPITAETVTQGTAGETEEQRQQRQYEEESRKLANELREFDAQLDSKNEDAYKKKLKQEGLWRD